MSKFLPTMIFKGAVWATVLGIGASALSACAQESSDRQKTSGVTVVVEAEGSLTRDQRAQLQAAGVQVTDFLGNGEYLGYVGPEKDLMSVQGELSGDTRLRAYQPARKFADGFDKNAIPEYARVGSKIRVLVEFFEVDAVDPVSILSGYGEDVEIDANTARWGVTIAPEVLEKLSTEGAVKRIDLKEDPKLLRMEE